MHKIKNCINFAPRNFLIIEMNIGDIIKKAGLKATPQRKMIYEIMTELGHSSIDNIIVRLHDQSPEITVSTIYRVLDSFCKVGLVTKISNQSGKTYYDITHAEHHHVYIDNEIVDYDDPELTMLIKKHLKEKGFKHLDTIEKVSLQIIISDNKN